MPHVKGTSHKRRKITGELDRIFHLIARDDLDADAIAERWGVAFDTARVWRQKAFGGRGKNAKQTAGSSASGEG